MVVLLQGSRERSIVRPPLQRKDIRPAKEDGSGMYGGAAHVENPIE